MKDYRKYKKNFRREIRKAVKQAKQRVPIDELNLRLVPDVLQRKIIEREGLIKDSYKEGDYVVEVFWIGDVYLLSSDFNNKGTMDDYCLKERIINYRQIWENVDLHRRYDDWNGGSIVYIPPIIGGMDQYYGKLRLATKKEIELCQQ